jgi:hypothetical protein
MDKVQKYNSFNKIYKTTTLTVLYGCKTWSLTLGEKNRSKEFQKRVMRICGHKRKLQEDGEDSIMRSFIN